MVNNNNQRRDPNRNGRNGDADDEENRRKREEAAIRRRREEVHGIQGEGAFDKIIWIFKEYPLVPLGTTVAGMTLMYINYELRRFARLHPPPPPPPPPPFYVTYRPVIIKGAVCGLLLTGLATGIYISTRPTRDRRRRLE